MNHLRRMVDIRPSFWNWAIFIIINESYQHFKENSTQRPPINSFSISFLAKDFRSNIIRSSDNSKDLLFMELAREFNTKTNLSISFRLGFLGKIASIKILLNSSIIHLFKFKSWTNILFENLGFSILFQKLLHVCKDRNQTIWYDLWSQVRYYQALNLYGYSWVYERTRQQGSRKNYLEEINSRGK